MSQEINLLNPALRPPRDLLTFKPVAVATVASVAFIAALFAYARFDAAQLDRRQADAKTQLADVQQQLQKLQADLSARKPSAALEQEVSRLSGEAEHRGEILRLAEETTGFASGSLADVMRGFANQTLPGVWLTGFAVGTSGIDIRGRLLDPSLLPVYIRRLNGEPAFRGRLFAALDMQGVIVEGVPASAATPASSPVPQPRAVPRYTEFVLRASPADPGGRE